MQVETELIAIKSELMSISSYTADIRELRSYIYNLELELQGVQKKIGSTNFILEEMLRIMKANQTFR